VITSLIVVKCLFERGSREKVKGGYLKTINNPAGILLNVRNRIS